MEFHANVPVASFKQFSAMLELCSNLSELVNIDARNTHFLMSSINHSRTAQCLITLSPHYFEDYKLLRRGSPDKAMYCTVSIKNFNSMFKKNVGNTDAVKMIQISITQGSVNNERHTEARIHLKLIYQNGITKKSSLCYTDSDPVEPLFPRNNMHNFSMSPLILKGCLPKFHPKVTSIKFECTPHLLRVGSYWKETATSGDRPLQSSFTFSTQDCYEYSIIEPVKVVCNLKEFKAYNEFIEYVEGTIYCAVEQAGKPILFKYEAPNLILKLALMTPFDESSTDASGDMPIDEFTLDSVSTSEIFNQTPPPRVQQPRSQQQRRPNESSSRQQRTQPSSGSSRTENINVSNRPPSSRGTERRPTEPVSSSNRVTQVITSSNKTTQPVMSSNESANNGNQKSSSSGSSLPNASEDSEDGEPLFRRQPVRRTELDDDSEENVRRETRKVTPTGNRLTTLQQLRLKHQMRNSAATGPNPDTTMRDANDSDNDEVLARMKYENLESISSDEQRPTKRSR